MSGQLLTTQSTLMCPHGGTVSIVSSNTGTKAGAALALASDTFTIAGCPFQIPAGPAMVPHPCMTVQWIVPNTRTMVNNKPTLSTGSSGLCLAADQVPQGAVVISQTQAKASAQ
jgi:hypothetical protein